MKLETLLIAFLGIFLYDLYYDHILWNTYKKYKKYGTFVFYIFVAFSLYLMFKRDPSHSYHLMQSVKNIIHHAPIDKESKELFSPLLQIPNLSQLLTHHQNQNNSYTLDDYIQQPQYKRMLNSGKQNNCKRSVSETKKKHVASRQDWKCSKCGMKLPGSFEVDHIQALHNGGSNHVDNLEALCRNCHGEKTAQTFL